MASITSWTRLEPRARSAAMRASLEAQLADPLWMLGRQWQMLEFAGHDGGSAVQARLRAESSPVSRWLPGRPTQGSTGRKLTPLAEPLEEIVEREGARAPSKAGIREAAEAGLAFLRLLDDAGLASEYGPDYLSKYPIQRPTPAQRKTLDPETLRLLDVVATRAPHGGKLYADLDDALRPAGGATGALPGDPAIDPGDDTDQVTAVARTWLDWYDDVLAPSTGAKQPWTPERLEYEFAVGARTSAGQAVLTASGYHGGELDWHAFDLHPTAGLGTGGDPQPTSIVRTLIPAPIRYRGMPQPRFWEFEDEITNLGAVEAAADDLGRMLLIEFALVYGNDHFVIPVDLEVGSVCEVNSLVVTDSFGERTLVRSARDVDGATGAWAMFELSLDRRDGVPTAPPSELFFLPPTLGPNLEGDPIEDVLLIRDEMANMAWAVERSVEGGGGPIDRFEAWQERRRRQEQAAEAAEPGSTAPKTGGLEYRLSSEVPEHWFPLLPVAVGTTEMAFRLGEVATHPPGNLPLGRVLEPYDAQTLIREEEVPRAGARVHRAYQYSRWVDGSTHLWVGRRKRTGRGEGSSGLRWDIAEPGEATET